MQRRPACEAAFEVVACGPAPQEIEGNALVNPFTGCIVKHIEQLVALASAGHLKRKACFTLSERLGDFRNPINDVLDNNPIRLSTCPIVSEEKVPRDKVVPRLYFDPEYIRQNKKLALQCDVVKDKKKEMEEKARKLQQELEERSVLLHLFAPHPVRYLIIS